MGKTKLDLSILKQVEKELEEKVISNYLSHIAVVNSTDILIAFSFYTKEKLLISLNHASPFISLIDRSFVSATTLGSLNDNLRKLIKGAYIRKIEVINNDRILKFSLTKTNEFYEHEVMYLILELIPTKTNLVILNEKEEILFAYHYQDLTSYHPVIKNGKYEYPEKIKELEETYSSLDDYKNEINAYLIESEAKRKKEIQKPLYDRLVHKKKSLERKIKVLNKEIDDATNGLIYKEYGEMIFAYLYDKDELDKYIKELGDIYNPLLSATENANKMFDKYKKNKRTIEMDNLEISKADTEIDELMNYINTFAYLDEDEFHDLYQKYLPKKCGKPKKKKADAKLPFYIKVGDTAIGFGKNSRQNDYLSFKKARKNDMFLHINEFSGSHVVIFNDQPNNEEILTAAEICLILSNKTVGDVQFCQVKEIKKGTDQGKVQLNSYKLITLNKIRSDTYNLLLHQKRFDN